MKTNSGDLIEVISNGKYGLVTKVFQSLDELTNFTGIKFKEYVAGSPTPFEALGAPMLVMFSTESRPRLVWTLKTDIRIIQAFESTV